MKLEGSYMFDAPRDVVWSALLDPVVLANTMPGCEQLNQVGENQYRGTLKIKVGPVQGQFEGLITLSDIKSPESYHMIVDGKGAPGFVKGEGGLRLEEQNGSTIMHYEGDAQVGGRLASVGQRLLDSSAKALIRQSLDGLHEQVKSRARGEVTGEPVAPPEAPSQLQFAAGVARNLVEEWIPEEQRPQLIQTALMALAAAFVFWLFSEWWTNRLANRIAKKIRRMERRS